ncbi:MAG: transposase [Thermodesulfobacteriota bacterium]
MGRPIRIEYEGALYHVMSRGNERKDIYKDDEDRDKFLSILSEYHLRYGILIHCYVLMNNHYHVVMETPRANLVKVMHGLNSRYTGYFNRKYSRSGHLFQGRYKAIIVEKEEYLVELSRYIHLNPVRIGMVQKSEEYKWSSYEGFIKNKKELEWINYEWILSSFSKVKSISRSKYREYVREGIKDSVENPLNKVIGQIVLGGEKLLEKVKQIAKSEDKLDESIIERKVLDTYPEVESIVDLVSEEFGVRKEDIKTRNRKENMGRNTAMYMLKKYSGKTNKEIGKMFGGLHYSSINRTVERLENKMIADKELRNRIKEIESHITT